MPSQTLNAKDLWDIASYIELTTCDVCQQGPLYPSIPLPDKIPAESSSLKFELSCSLCGCDQMIEFTVPSGSAEVSGQNQPKQTYDKPSTIVDLAGWLTLFRIFMDRSDQAVNSAIARTLALHARKCLDEGLMFFFANDDTPPPEAFFSQQSLTRFQAQPQHYSRQRIINLRSPLPKQSSL